VHRYGMGAHVLRNLRDVVGPDGQQLLGGHANLIPGGRAPYTETQVRANASARHRQHRLGRRHRQHRRRQRHHAHQLSTLPPMPAPPHLPPPTPHPLWPRPASPRLTRCAPPRPLPFPRAGVPVFHQDGQAHARRRLGHAVRHLVEVGVANGGCSSEWRWL
jgi:hypothetical protein